MILCIPKNIVDLFLGKLKSGEINPDKLNEMTSKERNEYFKSFMGENNATKVNALFESKLLLKNQQQGIINWAKQVSGIKPKVKRDLLSRIEKMTNILQPKEMDSFLSDLAAQKLGFGVRMEEAGKIADLAKTTSEKKTLITEDMPDKSQARLDYGTSFVLFKDYVGGLKAEAKALTTKEFMLSPGAWIDRIGSTTKSILSSLDNSFFGRQGLVTLITNTDIWSKNFNKSWVDIGKELSGVNAILPIKADVYSRKNALNGKYEAMGLDIGISGEEAFPSSLPGKIPLLGKLYKASESAYNGAALRIRVDLADRLIERAESFGINVKDKEAGLGTLINSMTGRGNVHMTAGQARATNVTIFSVKYVKSQFDVLTAHVFNKKMDFRVKKIAAENLVKVIGTLGGILAVSNLLDDESVEFDPRSSNFGKILVGHRHEYAINISAGLGSMVTLAARMTPHWHNGKWGWWTKTSNGRVVQINTGKYGESNPIDVVINFITGKASPISRVALDLMKGKTYHGKKPTVEGELVSATTPIPVQNIYQMAQQPGNADVLLKVLLTALDLLGVGINVKNKRR